MNSLILERQGDIHILKLIESEHDNTFTSDVMREFLSAFDQVEAYDGNTALVITSDHEKTFTTGIRLDWLVTLSAEQRVEFINLFERVLYRLYLLNVPTLAAINGNTYAGGAILASACDFRVMRADRGRFCFPEINVKVPFTPMMHTIIEQLTDSQTLRQMAFLGSAYTGEQCLAKGIVDALHSKEALADQALAFAGELAQKDRATYQQIKHGLRSAMLSHKASIFTE